MESKFSLYKNNFSLSNFQEPETMQKITKNEKLQIISYCVSWPKTTLSNKNRLGGSCKCLNQTKSIQHQLFTMELLQLIHSEMHLHSSMYLLIPYQMNSD